VEDTHIFGARFGKGTAVGGGWSLHALGFYQLPGNFTVAAQAHGREGAPLPCYRLPDLFTLDARLGRDFAWRDFQLTASLEVLNLTDEGTALTRQTNLGLTRVDAVDDTLLGRTPRLGLRLHWP